MMFFFINFICLYNNTNDDRILKYFFFIYLFSVQQLLQIAFTSTSKIEFLQ